MNAIDGWNKVYNEETHKWNLPKDFEAVLVVVEDPFGDGKTIRRIKEATFACVRVKRSIVPTFFAGSWPYMLVSKGETGHNVLYWRPICRDNDIPTD